MSNVLSQIQKDFLNWKEDSSGHLVADTTNTRDIGTTSNKIRSLYVGTNATIDGTLTVAGTNVIPYIASIALVASQNASAISNLLIPQHIGHRLTVSSTDPYVTGDDTGNTNLYLLPFRDNLARLYTGSTWVMEEISSLSFDLTTDNDIDAASIAASSAYDAFIDYNGGTPQLAAKKWTSAGYGTSTRATALTRQDGVLVMTGATDHLYIGSFLTNASTQLDIGSTSCKVWNYYNQMPHYFTVDDNTTHSYNGAYRAWNNDTSLRVEFILGQTQTLTILGNFGAIDNVPNHGGVSLDSTTGTPLETVENRSSTFYRQALTAMARGVGAGAHYLQAVEGTESSGTTSFYEAKLEFEILA